MVSTGDQVFCLSWNTTSHCCVPPGSCSTMVGVIGGIWTKSVTAEQSCVLENVLWKCTVRGRMQNIWLTRTDYPKIVSVVPIFFELNYGSSETSLKAYMSFTENSWLNFTLVDMLDCIGRLLMNCSDPVTVQSWPY